MPRHDGQLRAVRAHCAVFATGAFISVKKDKEWVDTSCASTVAEGPVWVAFQKLVSCGDDETSEWLVCALAVGKITYSADVCAPRDVYEDE